MLTDKIKKLRRDKGLSQEDLAELLDVSRQSISKYEQGSAYPDYEKLARLANYFNVSFDYLLGEGEEKQEQATAIVGNTHNKIAIISATDGKLSSYYKFSLAKTFKPKEWSPRAMLMGVEATGFWGDEAYPLGWYATVEDGQKEITAIYRAIAQNKSSYELQYSVQVKKKGLVDIQVDWQNSSKR